MAVQSSNGTQLAISAGPPATEDALGYGALVYTEIGEVSSYGTISAEAQVVTFTAVADEITRKLKGSRDYGSQDIGIGEDLTDAGQILIRAGFDGADRNTYHSIRLTRQDGSIKYYQALIMKHELDIGESDQVVMLNTSFAITSIDVEA